MVVLESGGELSLCFIPGRALTSGVPQGLPSGLEEPALGCSAVEACPTTLERSLPPGWDYRGTSGIFLLCLVAEEKNHTGHNFTGSLGFKTNVY